MNEQIKPIEFPKEGVTIWGRKTFPIKTCSKCNRPLVSLDTDNLCCNCRITSRNSNEEKR